MDNCTVSSGGLPVLHKATAGIEAGVHLTPPSLPPARPALLQAVPQQAAAPRQQAAAPRSPQILEVERILQQLLQLANSQPSSSMQLLGAQVVPADPSCSSGFIQIPFSMVSSKLQGTQLPAASVLQLSQASGVPGGAAYPGCVQLCTHMSGGSIADVATSLERHCKQLLLGSQAEHLDCAVGAFTLRFTRQGACPAGSFASVLQLRMGRECAAAQQVLACCLVLRLRRLGLQAISTRWALSRLSSAGRPCLSWSLQVCLHATALARGTGGTLTRLCDVAMSAAILEAGTEQQPAQAVPQPHSMDGPVSPSVDAVPCIAGGVSHDSACILSAGSNALQLQGPELLEDGQQKASLLLFGQDGHGRKLDMRTLPEQVSMPVHLVLPHMLEQPASA